MDRKKTCCMKELLQSCSRMNHCQVCGRTFAEMKRFLVYLKKRADTGEDPIVLEKECDCETTFHFKQGYAVIINRYCNHYSLMDLNPTEETCRCTTRRFEVVDCLLPECYKRYPKPICPHCQGNFFLCNCIYHKTK